MVYEIYFNIHDRDSKNEIRIINKKNETNVIKKEFIMIDY